MRIALIHYRLVLKGGLETRLKNYIEYFTSRGDEVTVICSRVDHEIQLPVNTTLMRLNLGIMPKVFRKWFFNYRLKQAMAENKFDFSLSLGRTTHQDAILAPSNHLGHMRAMGSLFYSLADVIRISLDKRSFARARIIYAASGMMQEELIRFYKVDPRKIHVLYPPVNTRDFNRDLKHRQAELKPHYGMDPGKVSFLFVSSSHKRKGLDLLIRTFRILDPERFELFIAGDDAHVNAYPNIHALGFHRSLREIYTAADMTVHPAAYEPFGQIISESLQCGTPVMVSELTGAREILTPSTGLIIPGFDPADWARQINDLDISRFDIPEDFAASLHLTLEQHCEDMLHLWNMKK